MKYIVCHHEDAEEIFVFPRCVDHDRMWEALQAIRFGSERNWERSLRGEELVSAGFITGGDCHGRSETLDIGTRGAVDTELFAKRRMV